MLEAAFAPGRNGAFGVTRRIASPRRQAGNSRHAPVGQRACLPALLEATCPRRPRPKRVPLLYSAAARRFPACASARRKKSSAARRPEPEQIPRGGKHFSRAACLGKRFFSLATTSPHALRDNNMRRRASLAFSPSASFSGHAPLPRALFFHRARRRTRPFFIYKHPG